MSSTAQQACEAESTAGRRRIRSGGDQSSKFRVRPDGRVVWRGEPHAYPSCLMAVSGGSCTSGWIAATGVWILGARLTEHVCRVILRTAFVWAIWILSHARAARRAHTAKRPPEVEDTE